MKLRQKPNGIWLVDFEDADGERRRVSTGIKTAKMRNAPPEARAKAKDIVLGLVPATSTVQNSQRGDGRVTMNDLFDRAERTIWHPSNAKSQGTIRSNIKILGAYIGNEPITEVTYTRLERLVQQLKDDKGYAPATIKRKLDMVSKVLRMATKWTDKDGKPLLQAKPPMPPIRVSNLKDRVVSRVEEVAIFNAIEARRQKEPGRQWFRLAALIRFLMDTGARLGEARGVTTDDVEQRRNGRWYVNFPRYRTKNDKPRTLPLTEAAVEALDSLRDHLGVAERDGRKVWLFFPMTSGTAWYMFNQIREDLKDSGFDIEDVTLHTLRHTALTRLAQGGMDLLRLQRWAGHSDPKITAERYTHLRPSDLDAGVDILGSNPSSPQNRGGNLTTPGIGIFPEEGVNRAKHGTLRLQ